MKKNIDEELSALDKKVKWILVFGAFVLVLMPILVTQLDWFLNFTGTGQIGDTIGGTTAPVIGAISALLIYYSFRAQINANYIIQQQIDDQKTEEASKKNFDHQMERYRHLREYIDGFKYTRVKPSGFYVSVYKEEDYNEKCGTEAITSFLKSDFSNSRKLSEFQTILSFYILILNNLIPEKDNKDSKFIFNLVEIQFYRKIWDANHDILKNILDNPNEYTENDIKIFSTIKSIEIELNKYKEIWPN